MKTVQALKKFIVANQGKTIRYGEKYSIQVYSGTVQAAISYCNQVILKIEERNENNNSLHFFLSDETDESLICYSKSCILSCEEDLVQLYYAFKMHSKIEQVLTALLILNQTN